MRASRWSLTCLSVLIAGAFLLLVLLLPSFGERVQVQAAPVQKTPSPSALDVSVPRPASSARSSALLLASTDTYSYVNDWVA